MLPQKKFYRQRAHSNPIADHCFDYPSYPGDIDWSSFYPPRGEKRKFQDDDYVEKLQEESHNNGNVSLSSAYDGPDFLDIGCGYGGLLIQLSFRFPDKKALGIEIRVKVCDYVQDRITALRLQSESGDCTVDNTHDYRNIACIRGNAMKHLPNFFPKSSVEKLFFLFPDPQFKKKKHKWRIISQQLLAEYAYVLKESGRVYIATDVKDLYDWMTGHLELHPLFESVIDHTSDPVVPLLFDSTEEGKKVTRMGGSKFIAVFERVRDPMQN
jgi:tRNA (guanine-N7-)-methyltransferase